MKHGNKNRTFGRVRKVRRNFLKGLAIDLLKHGKITTTEARAKELKKVIEPLVTRAKKDDVAGRRIVSARLMNNTKETKKLFDEIAPNYKSRRGGYTRITKLPVRKSDDTRMVVIEFV